MQLFTRRVQLAGPPAETMQYAVDMRAYVADTTGRDLALWSGMFGGPVGMFVYAVRVEGVADVMAMTSSLLSDQTYLDKLGAGAKYLGAPSEDTLAQPIHGELGDQSPPVGAIASVTTAQIANGMYEPAMAWGVGMAQHVEAVTGTPTMFLANRYGPFGTVTWISVTGDGASVDAAGQALWGDAEYMKRLGDAGDLFVAGSGNQALVTRIA